MYHSTTPEKAASIIRDGFRITKETLHDGRMLGDGIYVSSTIAKAKKFGDVTLKLLVYPGRICVINRKNHPLQKSWQSNYGSAWVPHNTQGLARLQVFNKTEFTSLKSYNQHILQENCVKSPDQIEILGVCRGYDLLDIQTKQITNLSR